MAYNELDDMIGEVKRVQGSIAEAMDEAVGWANELVANWTDEKEAHNLSSDNDNDSGEVFFTADGEWYGIYAEQNDNGGFNLIFEYYDND